MKKNLTALLFSLLALVWTLLMNVIVLYVEKSAASKDWDGALFESIVVGVCFFAVVVVTKRVTKLCRKGNVERNIPSLQHISNFADLFGLGLRKKIKAMAGDFDLEIKRLHKAKRSKTAKWNKALAWGYAVWYVVRGPIDWLAENLIKSWKGL